jgi:hypothetical protein
MAGSDQGAEAKSEDSTGGAGRVSAWGAATKATEAIAAATNTIHCDVVPLELAGGMMTSRSSGTRCTTTMSVKYELHRTEWFRVRKAYSAAQRGAKEC